MEQSRLHTSNVQMSISGLHLGDPAPAGWKQDDKLQHWYRPASGQTAVYVEQGRTLVINGTDLECNGHKIKKDESVLVLVERIGPPDTKQDWNKVDKSLWSWKGLDLSVSVRLSTQEITAFMLGTNKFTELVSQPWDQGYRPHQ